MNETPRVLLVGAGAVGQVFGKYLQAAGCELSFLVKEKYADEARRGFTLYELGMLEKDPEPVAFSGFGVLVSNEEVAARRWDQVWLCVSSTAMRAGSWVGELARATGDATWVMLQPSLDDRDWLLQWIPAERLVSSMIPFLSFHAPLKPGERFPKPGMAFWMPPMTRGPFSGPPERLQQVVRTLRAGGYPARASQDVARDVAIPSAVLTVFVNGLEAAGWSFERFLQHDSLERVHRAAREAVQVAAAHTKGSASAVLPLLRPALFKLLLPVASHLMPFDLEAYLRVHFTKVGEQMRLMMKTYVDLGRSAGLPVENLQAALR
ncbi:MAG TPA: 2-dehydropantoate 2-reductase N-terminal domain-containing protein [Archangium sp.]|uniref:ketopantoate reductase family protein n=1 Tax=Archangium sp. TaxID=1872627 RepID=UPI002E357756|nr:2-dehydropantoate 2-reductase N-terminal domain-containing protein [Archangium sp.]HEX5746131.1 2-dehydropantoate 2-reductase N-terminal domain-containing protein [Archangium sp.]